MCQIASQNIFGESEIFEFEDLLFDNIVEIKFYLFQKSVSR